jgi:aspartate-semialdehyde dehydrogenase
VSSEHPIAVIGATGAVGREALSILAGRGVPASRIRPIASCRSVGAPVPYGPNHLAALPLDEASLRGVTLALLCADADLSRCWAPRLVARGATVIDNSSAFRLDPRVPLVVPEVNGRLLDAPGPGPGRLIANPNCCVAILAAAVEPLRHAFGVGAVRVCTYQAVSGAGAAAVDELQTQCRDVLNGHPARPAVFREPCAFNVFAHDSAVDPDTGLCGEERKIIDELRRLWDAPDLPVSPVCVRVPVARAHTLAIGLELCRPARIDEARALLAAGAGLELVDDRAGNDFPTPLKAAGRDPVLVGRLRADPARPAEESGATRFLQLTACADQLRKGAALNAVQIAERLGSIPPGLRHEAGLTGGGNRPAESSKGSPQAGTALRRLGGAPVLANETFHDQRVLGSNRA